MTHQPSPTWFQHEINEFSPLDMEQTPLTVDEEGEFICIADYYDDKTSYTVEVLGTDNRYLFFLLDDGYGFIDIFVSGHLIFAE